jgi:hypothetical protein
MLLQETVMVYERELWEHRNNTTGNKSVTQTVLNKEVTKCTNRKASRLWIIDRINLYGHFGERTILLALGAPELLVS